MQSKVLFSSEQLKKRLDWTGNIRELRNVVERLIILGGRKFENDVTLLI
jgi:transcriptional regulator with AAA-type ATPase domain